VSLCDVTFCPSVGAEQTVFGGTRTVQSDGNAFGQHGAICAYKNRHLAQRVYLEKFLIVFLIICVCVDDIQFEALRFGDS
jgi:hypothetical protein